MAQQAQVPHFDIPFKFCRHGGKIEALVVEQDSGDDINNCVEAALRYTRGQRTDEPTFGITDQTFNLQPLPLEQIAQEVNEHEARASLIIEDDPDQFDVMIARVRVTVVPGRGFE